jgi:hypothetical protein
VYEITHSHASTEIDVNTSTLLLARISHTKLANGRQLWHN